MQYPITLPHSRLPCFTEYDSFLMSTVCLSDKTTTTTVKNQTNAAAMWYGPPAPSWQRAPRSSDSTWAWQRTLVLLSSLRSHSDSSVAEWHIVLVRVSGLLALRHMCNNNQGRVERPKVILKTPATPVHPGTPCLFATVTAAMVAGLRLPGQQSASLAEITV